MEVEMYVAWFAILLMLVALIGLFGLVGIAYKADSEDKKKLRYIERKKDELIFSL